MHKYKFTWILRSSLFFAVFLSFACSRSEPSTELEVDKEVEDKKPIIMALIPEINIFEQRKRYLPLADYLSKKSGIPVKIKILGSYGKIVENFIEGDVDIAFVGSLDYVIIHAVAGAVVLARPQWIDGPSVYRGLVFTKRGTGVTPDIKTWRGKDIVLVHRFTTAGDTFPRAYLYENGVEDFDSFFGKSFYAGSHDASAMAVFNGEAALGAGKDLVFKKLAHDNPEFMKNMIVLAESGPVPSNGLVVSAKVTSEVRTLFKEIMIGMSSDTDGRKVLDLFRAKTFIETTDEDYRPLYEMLVKARLTPAELYGEYKKKEVK